MKKLLFKWFTRFEFVVRLSFTWWIWWSNNYQKFERKFLQCKPEWLQKYTGCLPPDKSWEQYCCTTSMKWSADGISKLFDVISCPERVIATRQDDCDGHAILAYSYFGRQIYYNGSTYKFVGLVSYITETMGHVVAAWQNSNGEYFMTSNGIAFFFDSLHIYPNIKYIAIVDISSDNKTLFLKQFTPI
jgi:hypothetical protein